MMAPLIVVFGSSLPSSKKKKKNVVKVGPPLTKLSGSAHAMCACVFAFMHAYTRACVDACVRACMHACV